ncbi:Uncharacterised protein [Vibrio cholerae]|nr:Uncharacterised protein [Vibrio cholerae]CSC42669.1 Uncharacterised protein [Vibrio cholerae]
MKPSRIEITVPVKILAKLKVPSAVSIIGPEPNADSTALPILLDCTPGSNTPQAKMVAIAKTQAYHF